jgi:2-oxoglutarate ferredoxin oxidoreductase subunit alpha
MKPGATILLENSWLGHRDPKVVESYTKTVKMLRASGYKLYELPLEAACSKLVTDPRKGKNMFVLGILCEIYSLDAQIAHDQVAVTFGKKDAKVVKVNQGLVDAGRAWAAEHIDFKYRIPAPPVKEPLIVVNGNTALGLGVLASGMDICSMYPITPATSTSHYLSECFERVGRHGAPGRGRDRGLRVRHRRFLRRALRGHDHLRPRLLPQAGSHRPRGDDRDPARGDQRTARRPLDRAADQGRAERSAHQHLRQPRRRAQGRNGGVGIEDCFYSVITARKIAETFNTVVVLLSDASLATAQQPFPRPTFNEEWLAPPVDQTPVPEGAKPYDWDPVTGIARRFVPGQPGGMHTLTGLAHDRASKVAYDAESNEDGLRSRSLKLAALQENPEGARSRG